MLAVVSAALSALQPDSSLLVLMSYRTLETDNRLRRLSAFARDEKVTRLAAEDLPHHRQKGIERLRRVRGIKGELVPPLAESYASPEVRARPVMVPEPPVLF